MNSNEIDIYLRVLDEELEKRPIRKPVRIVVVGGVYMLCFSGNRAATKDFGGIEIAPFKNNSPAAVSISADFEMAWGWRSRPGPECASKAANERRNVPSLLRALE